MYQQQASATSTWAKQPLCIQVAHTHRFIRITKTLLVSTWQSFSSSDHTFQEIASLDKGYFLETECFSQALWITVPWGGFGGSWCHKKNVIVPGLVETTVLLYNSLHLVISFITCLITFFSGASKPYGEYIIMQLSNCQIGYVFFFLFLF